MDAANAINNFTIYCVIGLGAGIYWFVAGFRELKQKRTIQDIPTSKIATGAVGTNVEIKGQVICDEEKVIPAPISETPSVFYSIEIQKLVRNKNSSYWKSIDRFYSDKGFFVDDGSGADALVYIEGATVKRKGKPAEFQLASNNFNTMPPLLSQALTKNAAKLKRFKLKSTSWLFSDKYRFLEWYFKPSDSIYVLGFAESGLKVPKRRKLKFKTFLKAKKLVASDPKLKKRFDSNKDGVLTPEELEWGAKVIGEQLDAKYDKKQTKELVSKTKMIFKHKKPHPFIVSNMHEENLVKSIAMTSTLKMIGGPIVAVACLGYLVFTLKNFL